MKNEILSLIEKNGSCFVLTHYEDILQIFEDDLSDDEFEYRGTTYDYDDILWCGESEPNYMAVGATLGSDPEFFFVDSAGDVVPSHKVIPRSSSDVVPDGFQGELNPSSDTCRQRAASYIFQALSNAYDYAHMKGLDVCLDVGKVVKDEVFANTPLSIRRFGCNPTVSAYPEKIRKPTGVRTKFRSAGGHIHIGYNKYMIKDEDELAKVMDIVAGNTAVLIDRDEDNIQRRKIYGRAGEYRSKSYGIEYRTLSNFWLKHPVLWSFASAQVRNALAITAKGKAKELLDYVDITSVRKAINTNDKELALKNFEGLVKFINDNRIMFGSGIDVTNIEKFLRWASCHNPIEFLEENWDCGHNESPLEAWGAYSDDYGLGGFEMFLKENF